jgi:hypothetical protein
MADKLNFVVPCDTAALANGILSFAINSSTHEQPKIKSLDIIKITKTAVNLTATVASRVFTVAGTISTSGGDKIRLTLQDPTFVGQGHRESFTYTTINGDTVTTTAVAIVALINGSSRFTATNSAGVITVTGPSDGANFLYTVYISSSAATFVYTSGSAGALAIGNATIATADGMSAANIIAHATEASTHVYDFTWIEYNDTDSGGQDSSIGVKKVARVYAENSGQAAIDALYAGATSDAETGTMVNHLD